MAAGLLAASVIGSLLAVGTVHVPTLLVVSVVALSATVLAVRLEIRASGRIPVSLPAAIVFALAAYTLLQAVPLPVSVLQRIAPANADVWQRALLPFNEPGPKWASISLDPGASLVEALKWFIYGGVFTTAAVISVRRGASWGVGLVFASAIIAVLTTIGHGLAGATRVFGVYQPHVNLTPWHMGPLLNANNFAGYLNLGAMCGLGLLLMHAPPLPRWAIGIGTAAIIGVAVTAASRAGFAVLPLGVLLFAAALRWRSRTSRRRVPNRTVLLLVGAAVVGGAAFAVLGGTRETWAELYDKNLQKFAMIRWVRPMIADHPLWGVGRGAFASVFPAYRTQPGHSVWTHPENFIVQWIVEWGIPVSVAALLLFAWLFRPGNLGMKRSAVASGAGVGVAMVLLQNLADLGTEIPGIGIALASVLGALWGDVNRRRASRSILSLPSAAVAQGGDLEHPGRRPGRLGEGGLHRAALVGIVLAAALLTTVVAFRGRHTLDTDRRAAYERFEQGAARSVSGRADLRRELKQAMLAHPAEPYFPLLGAITYWIGGDESPLPWIQRSLERSQVNGRAHLLLAELLAAKEVRPQSLFELRLAVQDDPGSVYAAARLATRVSRSYDEFAYAAPRTTAGGLMLDVCAASIGREQDPALRARLFHEAIARAPSLTRPHWTLASDLLDDLARAAKADASRQGESRCAGPHRDRCVSEFEEHVRALDALQPDSSASTRLRAKLLEINGKPEEAAQLLAARCPTANDKLACVQAQIALARSMRAPGSQLAALLKDAVALGCSSDRSCAQTSLWAGDTLAAHGDMGGAMTYYERAVREVSTEEGWLRLASAASHVGAHARAAEALERVARLRGGGDAELRARIDGERARAIRVMR